MGRFSAVGCTESSIYIVGMSNGMVKVGFSDNPRTRLEVLDTEVSRRFGCRVTALHIYYGIGSATDIGTKSWTAKCRAKAIEAMCISGLSAFGKSVTNTFEYFDGIGYDNAKTITDAIVASVNQLPVKTA
jgi:hypothetical protein